MPTHVLTLKWDHTSGNLLDGEISDQAAGGQIKPRGKKEKDGSESQACSLKIPLGERGFVLVTGKTHSA